LWCGASQLSLAVQAACEDSFENPKDRRRWLGVHVGRVASKLEMLQGQRADQR